MCLGRIFLSCLFAVHNKMLTGSNNSSMPLNRPRAIVPIKMWLFVFPEVCEKLGSKELSTRNIHVSRWSLRCFQKSGRLTDCLSGSGQSARVGPEVPDVFAQGYIRMSSYQSFTDLSVQVLFSLKAFGL